MAPVTKEGEPTAFGISPKTARAVADPWRLRILAEVSIKPLSPSQFVDEFGGELTHVSRCFRQLAKWDYVEVVERRPGRRRGAAIEHVYRAIRRAYFDTSTWECVPRGERDGASRSTLSAYQRHIRLAIKEGAFDRDLDRHLSWDAVALDRMAWVQVGERLDEVLEALAEHELAATQRLAGNGGEPIPATIGLAAFRSPEVPSLMLHGTRRRHGPADATEPGALYAIGPKLAKALSNRWRSKILSELSIRPLSPSQFVEEFGGSMSHVARCFRELAEWGFVEIFEERKGGRRGGGVERIYRSIWRPYFDTPTWEALPQLVRDEISQFFLRTYFERINEALEAGTFDADTDRHLSWKPIVIDRPSWNQLGEALDQILTWLPKLQMESVERTDEVEDLIPTTVGLACFRSAGRF
jgi:DNA-binding transcriptional ArsR family regulator